MAIKCPGKSDAKEKKKGFNSPRIRASTDSLTPIKVDIDIRGIRSNTHRFLEPIQGVFLWLSVNKNSNIRKVVIMVNNITQIDTSLCTSVGFNIIWSRRIELLIDKDSVIVLLLHIFSHPNGFAMVPFSVD